MPLRDTDNDQFLAGGAGQELVHRKPFLGGKFLAVESSI